MHESIRARTAEADPARRAGDRIFSSLRRPDAAIAPVPQQLPALEHLGAAVRTAAQCEIPSARHATALADIAQRLLWRQRRGAAAVGEPFLSGHANATIIGPDGLEASSEVWIGVSLLAPSVTYPDHRHPPEEVYVVLSPGEWRQNANHWRQPGIGGIVYNPPDILHAMRAPPDAPLLATWCLWLGGG